VCFRFFHIHNTLSKLNDDKKVRNKNPLITLWLWAGVTSRKKDTHFKIYWDSHCFGLCEVMIYSELFKFLCFVFFECVVVPQEISLDKFKFDVICNHLVIQYIHHQIKHLIKWYKYILKSICILCPFLYVIYI
jgi:hypothetical protein